MAKMMAKIDGKNGDKIAAKKMAKNYPGTIKL